MSLERAAHPGRVIAKDMDQPEIPTLGDPRRELRPAGQHDVDPQPARDEVDRHVVAAESSDAVEVHGQRGAIRRRTMSERGQVRIADENARI
jgi:hypothetical protein